MPPEKFRALVVSKSAEGQVSRQVQEVDTAQLPPGELLIRVAYSSLNFKDALSATGHPGVTRKFPHVPGIDAAGVVVESSHAAWKAGDQVLVNGFDLGQNTWGGWGELIRVSAGWGVRVPAGLDLRQCAIYGVAGFTAALSLEALDTAGITPAAGPILVTGATGGVGSVAVALLARRGFQVVAATGKAGEAEFLRGLGASEVVGRDVVSDASQKPLLQARWAGAVDTVGGNVLATVLRSCQNRACVAASGLVAGIDLPLTVYPFILRGVQLAGIDSATYPLERRDRIWALLAGDWRPPGLESLVAAEVDLGDLEPHIERILAGGVRGRVLVKHAG